MTGATTPKLTRVYGSKASARRAAGAITMLLRCRVEAKGEFRACVYEAHGVRAVWRVRRRANDALEDAHGSVVFDDGEHRVFLPEMRRWTFAEVDEKVWTWAFACPTHVTALHEFWPILGLRIRRDDG